LCYAFGENNIIWEGEMGRMTITLNNILEKSLRQIQGTFIHDFEKDWSFTTIVNMVILGGLIGAKKFKDEDWKIIHNFLEEEKLSLDLEAGIDSLASHVLDMKGWGQVVQQMQLKEAEKKAGEKK
jgi:hypothetical protein